MEHIPADLKDKAYWEPVKGQPLSTVLKNYGHAQERLGKTIVFPDKEDDVEGWNKVYTRLGRPESPDKYTYDLPKAEGIQWKKDGFDAYNRTAHSAGLSNRQAAAIAQWFTNDVVASAKAQTDAKLNQERGVRDKLSKEYGTNYDTHVNFAKRALEKYVGADAAPKVLETFAGDEGVLRGLLKLGKDLAEDGVFGKNPYRDAGGDSPAEAQKRVNTILGDRSHAYWGNPSDSKTQEAYREVENLFKLAYPPANEG
jgi:hypothetical protein